MTRCFVVSPYVLADLQREKSLSLGQWIRRGVSRNLGRGGGHRKGVGAGGGCAPSRAKRGSFEQYGNTDTHS